MIFRYREWETVFVTVFEVLLLVLTLTALTAIYEWKHPHIFAAND
jgi:hypothetical protein